MRERWIYSPSGLVFRRVGYTGEIGFDQRNSRLQRADGVEACVKTGNYCEATLAVAQENKSMMILRSSSS